MNSDNAQFYDKNGKLINAVSAVKQIVLRNLRGVEKTDVTELEKRLGELRAAKITLEVRITRMEEGYTDDNGKYFAPLSGGKAYPRLYDAREMLDNAILRLRSLLPTGHKLYKPIKK